MSDKSQTPTGVFVRLPLSEEARELLVGAAAFGQPDDSHDTALLAIGTLVAVDDLNPVAFMRPNNHASPGVSFRSFEGYIPLIRQSDAQAALAAAQAEIVRLREIIRTVDGLIMGNNDPIKMFVAIHSACQSALKGPEA